MTTNDELAVFFKDLARSLELNTLNQDQLKLISEFHMSYKFNDSVNPIPSQNQYPSNNHVEDKDSFEGNEFMKFVSLGWYIYNHLIPQEQDQDNVSTQPTDIDDVD